MELPLLPPLLPPRLPLPLRKFCVIKIPGLFSYLCNSSASAPAAGGNSVVVKAGDTCNAIAKASGTTVDDILKSNPSVNSGCTNLKVGDTLKFGGGGAAAGGAGKDEKKADAGEKKGDAAPPAASGKSFGTPPFNAQTPFDPKTLPPPNPACKKAKREHVSIKARIAQQDLPAVAQSWQDLCVRLISLLLIFRSLFLSIL